MNITPSLLLTSLCLLGVSAAQAAPASTATLRITCEDENNNPQV